MSHVTGTPQAPMASEGEIPGKPGVRKLLEAYAEREVQRIRWSAVIAGLFLAMGSEILLGSLGMAVGLTGGAPDTPGPLSRFGSSAGVWTVFSCLFSTFIGGYAAAKLGGAIRRADGVLSGTLTWATSLVLGLWMVLPSLSAASVSSHEARGFSNLARGAAMTSEARARSQDAAKSAWFIFGGASLSLLSALLGGAAGSVGAGSMGGELGSRRRDVRRRAEQMQGEREQSRQQEE
jgi:hypothetical protein